MVFQEHKNTFTKGLNADVDPNVLDAEQYIDAANVTLVPNGKFLSLQNIAGTTNLQSIGLSGQTVLGVFATRYTIGTTTNIPCLTIFTTGGPGSNMNIWCYDPNGYSGTFLYKLYQATTPSDYYTVGGGIVDGVLYPEKGMDILYFTDNYYETRKVRCNIQAPNIGANLPFLSDTNMAVARRRAIGQVNFVSTATGGTLLTGTYQLAYQLINLNTNQDSGYNKYTRFSLLTTPIHIYYTVPGYLGGLAIPFAGIGMTSEQLINVNITPTADELANYTHFRFAIVENINPEGVIALTAKVTEIQPIATYLSGGVITGYQIKNNYQTASVTVDEIVIDTAAIEHVKTLNIKNNVLFEGNINYKNLTYNNGTPAFTSGTIVQQTTANFASNKNSFSEQDFSTKYKGHFRDEVYRYAIAYFDKFGNFSSPSPLDMTAVGGNQSSASGFKDMRFPDRSQKLAGVTYGLFNTNGATQSLGLQLNAIANHPTWAYGFIILRVPRLKNIVFQTPLVPLVNVYGLGPLDNYPVIAQEGVTPANVVYNSGTATAGATGLQASPPGPINVLYPMNLNWPKKQDIIKVTADSGAALLAIRAGEAKLANAPTVTHAQIFPQSNLYTQNHPYVYSSSHQLKTIDAVVVRYSTTQFGTNVNGATTWLNGSGDTSVTTSFNGVTDAQYYYDSGNSGVKPALRSTLNSIAAYAPFANGSPGTVMNGKFVMTPDNLETKGVVFGWKPIIQKSAAIELESSVTEINGSGGLTFAIGAVAAQINPPTTDFYPSYGVPNVNINTLEIVNVLVGLNDTRYGTISKLNNYIYTGIQVNFTASEITNYISQGLNPAGIVSKNVTVFGGDCFVSGFNFKISDTVYSVTNQFKFAGVNITAANAISFWGRTWLNFTGPAVMSLPVALRNASQYLMVVLESEFNGSVVDFDTADYFPVNGFNIFGAAAEYKCRSPLVYSYNYNLNKENDQKIFVPIDPLNPVLTTLKSRIVYSATKIYNTSTDGFDTIPVLNFYDLPETYGGLTKLAIEGNNLYSIQQSGIAYVPIGQRVIETSDAANLQVRSGDIINTPVWIDIKRGSQHLRSVKETGTHIYMVDNDNQAIYRLKEQELTHISDKGLMTPARTLFRTAYQERNVLTIYDILRNEVWFAYNGNPDFCFVWNEQLQLWVSNYTFDVGSLQGGAFVSTSITPNSLLLLGQGTDNNQLSIHQMYTGTISNLMGTTVTPYVTFIANPDSDFGKTFDDVLVNCTEPMATLDTKVFRNTAIGFQSATTLSLNVTTRGEGNYRAKILRDGGTGARMRGNKAQHTLTWNTGSGLANSVTSVITQWRPSFKHY